jgi:hypothetical protein
MIAAKNHLNRPADLNGGGLPKLAGYDH